MRRLNKSMPSYLKINIIVSCLVVAIILCLTVGYSILSKELDINTTVTVRADEDVRITGAGGFTSENGGYEVFNVKYNILSVTANVGLPNLDSTVTYTITLSNNSSTPVSVKSISASVSNNDNATYYLGGIAQGNIIPASSKKVFTITYKYKDGLTSVTNAEYGSVIDIVTEEYIPEVETKDYVRDGLDFFLEGKNSPSSGTWIDSINNLPMTLNNVSYNSNIKAYEFSGTDSYATLGTSKIPATGDFTLEAYISSNTLVNGNVDEAIISQISDTTNDAGRFKLNLYKGDLIAFVNNNANNLNLTGTFIHNPVVESKQLLQLSRSGDYLYLYLNGALKSTLNYPATSKISNGPFKLGRWNNSTTQQFNGAIYSVRLYNKALSADELINNFEVDSYNYSTHSITPVDLVTAIKMDLTTSGSGLYDFGNSTFKYRGSTTSNYLKFKDNSTIYRIMTINDAGIQLIDQDAQLNIPFDESGNRNLTDSPYCTMSDTIVSGESINYGCNELLKKSDNSVSNDATMVNRLTQYYNDLPLSIKNKIISFDFPIGKFKEGIEYDQAKTKINSEKWNSRIGTLTMIDVVDAVLNRPITLTSNIAKSSYLSSFINKNSACWTLNATTENTFDVWSFLGNGTIGKRRASRLTQVSGTTAYTFYAKPVFYINSSQTVIGSGTSYDPYIVE